MLHRLTRILLKRSGKDYSPDPHIPPFFLMRIIMRRIVWRMWSLLRLQQAAFVSPLARIENSSNIYIGNNATIEEYAVINAISRNIVRIGERSKIGAFSRVIAMAHLSKAGEYFSMGDDSGCGEFCYFGSVGGIMIGHRVIMGQYVSFHSQEHQYTDTTRPIKDQQTTEKGIIIGDDCWIGAKATILDGTIIGKHCVIAAGAVVKGSFPDHSVIGGVPARLLRDIKDAA